MGVAMKFPWNTEAQEAFNKVKNCLVQASALQAQDPGKEFILTTDASDYAVGACLAQQDLVGKERPIAFLSKKLSPAQTRWATIETKAYAIISALGKLDVWLFGAKIKKLPWNTEAQEAFHKVKNCLVLASALQAPDPGKEFILATDASDYAIGAYLAQQDLVGKERPIAFLSKKLSPAQTRWATNGPQKKRKLMQSFRNWGSWMFGCLALNSR
ncbi:hypothetical protein MRX96_017441 [Rhipicephalus microplus]